MTVLEIYQAAPGWFVAGAVAIGLATGSFLNVVIHRLPRIWSGSGAPTARNSRARPRPPRRK